MIEVMAGKKSFTVSFNPSPELDIVGYVTHAVPESELVNGDFVPTIDNCINNGPDTRLFYQTNIAGRWYLKTAAYDSFEQVDAINYAGLNYSALHSVTVLDDAIVLPPELYNELRTDFIVDRLRLFFGTAPYTEPEKATLHWDGEGVGQIIRGSVAYSITGAGSIANANGKYVVAILDKTNNTASIKQPLPDLSAGVPTLVDDATHSEIVIAVTSVSPPSAGSNNVCYVRQSNSMEIEAALIRNLTVSNNLAVGNSISIGDAVLQFEEGQVRNSDISIASDGTLSGAGGGQVTIAGLGYIGALDATKNHTFYGSEDKSSAVTGDLWYDSANVKLKRYNGSSWVDTADSTAGILNLNTALTVQSQLSITGTGVLRAGKTGYSDNSTGGYWFDNISSQPHVNIGNATSYIKYDNSTGKVSIAGDIVMSPTSTVSWSQVQGSPTIPTNTNQLTDGAGLGTTAAWGSVSGRPNTTYIDGSGIYTGTLTSTQVNAVAINAGSITAGSLNVDRITANSIVGSKIGLGSDGVATSNLTANAVTQVVIANQASSGATLTITLTENTPIIVLATISCQYNATPSWTMEVTENGVSLGANPVNWGVSTTQFIRSPGVGTHTYVCQGGWYVVSTAITVIQLKR